MASSTDHCARCDLPVREPVTDPSVSGTFCCRGCLAVTRLIADGDLEGEEAAPSVDGELPRNEEPAGSGTPPGVSADADRIHVRVDGMSCTSCERFLEATAREVAGVSAARASYATERVTAWVEPAAASDDDVAEPSVDATDLADALSRFGYHATAGDDPSAGARDRLALGEYRAGIAIIASMPVMMLYVAFVYPAHLGLFPESLLADPQVGVFVLLPAAIWATLVLVGLGYPVFRGAFVGIRVGQPNSDLLIALAVLAAYGHSVATLATGGHVVYFDVVVMVLAVVAVGETVETRLKRDALGLLADLTAATDRTARRVRPDGSVEEVEREDLRPDDRVRVRPGERVPVDGEIHAGETAVDESLVSGESKPRPVEPGDDVVGGSVVVDHGSPCEVTVGEDATGTLDRLVDRMRTAQSVAAGPQRYADRFAVAFVPAVLFVAGLTALGWWWLAGAAPGTALLVAATVLLVSCPCSLGIATPLALARGVRDAADRGVAVLDAAVLERLLDADTVVLDKTGTLTTGTPTVERVIAPTADGGPVADTAGNVAANAGGDSRARDDDAAETLLTRAAAVESAATHPVAGAVVDAARDGVPDETVEPPADFERDDRDGRAVWGTVDDTRVTVGHPEAIALAEATVPSAIAAAQDALAPDETPVAVAWDGRVRGLLVVADPPRPEWTDVLDRLADADREIVVLTGDTERAAARFDDHPAVDRTFTEVRPGAKEAVVAGLRRRGPVAMVGDGTNDAPALATADLGVAMGGGTDLAVDAADAVVTDDDLETLPALFAVADATRRRVRSNLLWAVGYNAVAVPLAVAGLVTPLVAALLMAASSLAVVWNSGRGTDAASTVR